MIYLESCLCDHLPLAWDTTIILRAPTTHLWTAGRTGDEAMICKSPLGNEHVIITDQIKDPSKVRGQQVCPLELKTFLLTHPAVSDCCVVLVLDARLREV